MLIRKAYKFRLYPNQGQQTALAVQFGHTRFVYNHFLNLRQDHYALTGEGLYYRETSNHLTELKQDPEHEWLKEADSQVLQQKLMDLDRAYKNFFEGKAKYPRFKSRKSRQTIRYPQRVKVDLEAKRTYLPKVGWVKAVFHRKIEGKLKNVTVSRTKSGKFFASFQVEVTISEPEFTGDQAGIDLGLTHFAALSDGCKVENPRQLIRSERRLRRLQKSLSRRKKGSAGREKQRLLVARQHEKVANQRQDFQHKLSLALVKDHRFLAMEDLHIKGMGRNKRLAKHISDAAWGQFTQMLEYKGAWYGCEVVKIDRWYPSSKTCSTCDAKMEEMPLHIRKWQCPECGAKHDRDINAAKNILKQTTAGTAESHAGGVHVRPGARSQAGTLKPEALHFSGG
jgi:putative transposase